MNERLRRVCSACRLVMDEGTPGARITHGFCPPCELAQWEETGLPQSLWPRRVVEFVEKKDTRRNSRFSNPSPDERRRRLERAAKAGDHDAAARLRQEEARLGMPTSALQVVWRPADDITIQAVDIPSWWIAELGPHESADFEILDSRWTDGAPPVEAQLLRGTEATYVQIFSDPAGAQNMLGDFDADDLVDGNTISLSRVWGAGPNSRLLRVRIVTPHRATNPQGADNELRRAQREWSEAVDAVRQGDWAKVEQFRASYERAGVDPYLRLRGFLSDLYIAIGGKRARLNEKRLLEGLGLIHDALLPVVAEDAASASSRGHRHMAWEGTTISAARSDRAVTISSPGGGSTLSLPLADAAYFVIDYEARQGWYHEDMTREGPRTNPSQDT